MEYDLRLLRGLVAFFFVEVVLINVAADIANNSFVYRGLCTIVAADWIPALIAPIDIISNVLCWFLFYRKMKVLWRMVSGVSEESVGGQMVELSYVIRKYSVLTAFSAVSTILIGMSVAVTPIFWTVRARPLLFCSFEF